MKGFKDLYKNKKSSISSKKDYISENQIIDQAIKFHIQGNIQKALELYENILKRGSKDIRVLSNYGLILQNLGKLEDAEKNVRKAIKINSNFVDAYSLLGNILRDLGKLEEAEKYYRQAIELKPDFAIAHCNLGNLLRDLGNLKESESYCRKAIELKPDFAIAYSNLGNTLYDLGKLEEAFYCFSKVIKINPELSNLYNSITFLLKSFNTSNLNLSELKEVLDHLLARNDIYHHELFNSFKLLHKKEIIDSLEKSEVGFKKIDLLVKNDSLMNAFKKIIFRDFELEIILKNVRKDLCKKIANNPKKITQSELKLLTKLGEQCFLNEHVYLPCNEENINIKKIINRCSTKDCFEEDVAILSCYFPLHKMLVQLPKLKFFKTNNQDLKELINLQIFEPLQEIEISKKIKSIGTIKNKISKKVKSQYEDNPYPRWRFYNSLENKKLTPLQAINSEINPNLISKSFELEKTNLKVLIAGCGTGQQILQAQRYKNAQITAIDLSLTSLSYAQRKMNELGIDNVELIQMDILEVNLLEKQFDIIECSGVLHHMDDPSNGLKLLLKVLKKDGFLKLGLYSELARKDIVLARNYIESKNIISNTYEIQKFRNDIISGKLNKLRSLLQSDDFYNLSSCRDLCFHLQEHRFTIKQLNEMMNSNGLEFQGFLLPNTIKNLYSNSFPDDKKQVNLQNWVKFEERNPNTFASMYQFWVSIK
tara:strand:+ start:193 stop:2316 length:2124 start_codon:yes stop_codon:yes gene_type:complete